MATQVEKEAVFYCTMGDPSGLSAATEVVDQVQAEAELNGGVRIRVRRVEVQGRISYECTTKTKVSGEGGVEESLETTVPVDESFFKSFCKGAKHILKKTRYVFRSKQVLLTLSGKATQESVKLGDVNYEVDVYKNHAGETIPLVKIDVEVDSITAELKTRFPDIDPDDVSITVKLSSLPFEPTNVIVRGSATDEQVQRIDKFWEEARLPV